MILKIALVVIGFGLTILVHELGHFLMARRFGVKVEVFSIGMGPWKWTMFTQGGTKFILSLIPIGGYVKMLGQEDVPSGQEKPLTPDHFLAKTPWQRMGIICAGVIMNVIFAYLVMLAALWIGVPFVPAEVGALEVGSPAARPGGLRPGDVITRMDGHPVDNFVDVMTNVALNGGDGPIDFALLRDGRTMHVTVTPERPSAIMQDENTPPLPRIGIGQPVSPVITEVYADSDLAAAGLAPGMAFVSARIAGLDETITRPQRLDHVAELNPGKAITLTVQTTGGDRREIGGTVFAREVPERGFMTTAVIGAIPGGPAEAAGLRTGDVITAVAGAPVRGWQDVLDLVYALPAGTAAIAVTVRRGGVTEEFTVTPYVEGVEGRVWLGVYQPGQELPELFHTVTWVDPALAAVPGILQIGDVVGEAGLKADKALHVTYRRNGERLTCAYPPPVRSVGLVCAFSIKRVQFTKGWDAFGYVFVRTGNELKNIYVFLGKLVTGRLSHKLLGGPVRIVNITYHVAGYGMGYLLYFFAVIGVNLAVVNLLPIPVLDGGILVFLLYELVRGKPASVKVQVIAQYVGVAFIALLFLFVTWNDIASIWLK
ncbi:MAG: site-2 protease family protein [Planctomycetota bacterium]